MAKKRIADLLRQEAKKFSQTEEVSVESDISDISKDTASDSETSKPTEPNLAELQALVTELTAALEQARKNEAALQQQIADLKFQLEEQKSFGEKLEKEFKLAKKAAVDLAEANTKLIEEIQNLKKQEKQEEKKQAQIPKKPAPQVLKFDTQPIPQSGDFAANSWLLD
ncbi:MAG: hypothetical protein N3E45_13375 [Oscillatoriaceae bacterium SKW80]|nr:hypothetical protein [Oscillatoriaceae bacterium SKYG93]MCX8121791.1 hypothetical protein [Oscillatoriaceae bacterium SKW80]MDW8452554.1 hypothetical protein [Oscillatoriaceae cyanobacterium SKYGB_i_bin93]HIK28657.1 hypothetical protein [Oscillatoriaceae cyanobacterium M7585_C2015_266]